MERIPLRSLVCQGEPWGGEILVSAQVAVNARSAWPEGSQALESGSVIIAISTSFSAASRGNGLLKNAAKQLSFILFGCKLCPGDGRLRRFQHQQYRTQAHRAE